MYSVVAVNVVVPVESRVHVVVTSSCCCLPDINRISLVALPRHWALLKLLHCLNSWVWVAYCLNSCIAYKQQSFALPKQSHLLSTCISFSQPACSPVEPAVEPTIFIPLRSSVNMEIDVSASSHQHSAIYWQHLQITCHSQPSKCPIEQEI